MRAITVVTAVLALGLAAGAQTQDQMTEQVKKEYLNADRELARYIDKIAPTLSRQEYDRLKRAQDAWLEYRDTAAASESAFYSQGSTQALVQYTALKELTAERLQRLKSMMSEVEQAVETKPVDPKERLHQALASPAIAADVSEMKQELRNADEARRYLEVVVPQGETLVDVLARQKLDPDYLAWLKENPERARDIVKVAVAESLQDHAAKDKKGFKSSNIETVTQFLQVQNGKGGLLGSQLGQIAADVAIRPLPPYRFYAYLMQEDGMKELTENYISSKVQAQG